MALGRNSVSVCAVLLRQTREQQVSRGIKSSQATDVAGNVRDDACQQASFMDADLSMGMSTNIVPSGTQQKYRSTDRCWEA